MRTLGMLALALGLCGAVSAGAAEPSAQYSSDEFVRAILSGPQPCPKGVSLQACEANPKTRRFSLGTPCAQLLRCHALQVGIAWLTTVIEPVVADLLFLAFDTDHHGPSFMVVRSSAAVRQPRYQENG